MKKSDKNLTKQVSCVTWRHCVRILLKIWSRRLISMIWNPFILRGTSVWSCPTSCIIISSMLIRCVPATGCSTFRRWVSWRWILPKLIRSILLQNNRHFTKKHKTITSNRIISNICDPTTIIQIKIHLGHPFLDVPTIQK